jgi:hypothetical protein
MKVHGELTLMRAFQKELMRTAFAHLLPFPKHELHGKYKAIAETPRTLQSYEIDHSNDKVFFGIGTSWSVLEQYAMDCALISPDEPRSSAATIMAAEQAIEHLCELCGERLQLQAIISPDHEVVISLYSNYTMQFAELDSEFEEALIHFIKEQLKLNPMEQAMWFHPLL